jgi:hypothetical protein
MSLNRSRLPIVGFTLWGFFLWMPLLFSQSDSSLQPLPKHSENSFAHAANRWQLTVIDPKSQADTVSPALRSQRNAFWKGPLEYASHFDNFGGGTHIETEPEFPDGKNSAWVIATFESFHVYAVDPDDQLLYTEMNFRLEDVVKQSASLSLSAGMLVDADIPGGRVKTTKGDIVSSQITPQQYFLQLGHKYLLHLSHQESGGFFWADKRWDLTSGKVQPDDVLEIHRNAIGKSSIAGMSVAELLNYLPSVLPEDSKAIDSNTK